MFSRETKARTSLHSIQWIVLLAFGLAWPWEVFQRLPTSEITLTKFLGLLLILLAAVELFLKPKLRRLRTGLEWPVALLALACVQSTFHSADSQISRDLLFIYISYLALFYAIVVLVSSTRDATLLANAFTYSCVGVALLALACASGLAAPTLAGAAYHLGTRLTTEMRVGALVRFTATTPDFNQAVLTLLLALPCAMFLTPNKERGRWRSFLAILLSALLIMGIVVSFSRSSLLAAGVIVAVTLGTTARKRFGLVKLIAACIFIGIAVTFLASPYLEALSDRALRGIFSRDSSYETRMYGFRVAFELLPKYGWFGTGLGASDIAIQSIADPVRLGGTTLHSVPFKFFLETGILGLVAYLWLWIWIFRAVWRELATSQDSGTQRFGFAMLGVFFGGFSLMSVQPFLALSLFPFLLGLAFGPIAVLRNVGPITPRPDRRPIEWAVAGGIVLLVVVPNLVVYQSVFGRVSRFASNLDNGPEYENKGDWTKAESAYRGAYRVADGDDRREFMGESPLSSLRYYDIAERVVDLRFIYGAMLIGHSDPGPLAASMYGLGRVHYASGNLNDAIDDFERALALTPDFADAQYALAETYWSAGNYVRAREAYMQAAVSEDAPSNKVYKNPRTVVDARIDALSLSSAPTADGLIEAAWLVRTRGRWDDAIELCRRAIALDPRTAQAYFMFGADEEVNARPEQAITMYQQALQRVPNHPEAARRLRALERDR